MINLVLVLQELSRPIKKDKVELMSLYDSANFCIQLREDEARLNCSKDKLTEWIGSLSRKTTIARISSSAHSYSAVAVCSAPRLQGVQLQH